MKRMRTRLTVSLLLLVILASAASLTIYLLIENGALVRHREDVRVILFGLAAKDAILIVLSIAAVAMLVFFTSRGTANPIRDLTRATRAIADGDFDVTVDIRDKVEEMGELERNFNLMAAQLRSNEYLRKDFISNVSHELKTPLSILSGYARLLEQGGLSEEERQEYSRYVAEEAERMTALVDNMLRLSRIDHGEIKLKKTAFPLGEQLRRTILQLEPRWNAAAQSVDAEIEDINYTGDPELLYQVWVNLLDNAVKFSGEGGHIAVSLGKTEDGCTVTVADNGPGMDSAAAERIFEQFYQAETAHRGEGAGLGLPLAKRIVELHGGTLTAESTPGEGSTFRVFLPK